MSEIELKLYEREVIALETIAAALAGKKPEQQQVGVQTELDFDAYAETPKPLPVIPPMSVEQIEQAHREQHGRQKGYKRYTGKIAVFDTKEGKGYVFDRMKEALAHFGLTGGGAVTNAVKSGRLYQKRYKFSKYGI